MSHVLYCDLCELKGDSLRIEHSSKEEAEDLMKIHKEKTHNKEGGQTDRKGYEYGVIEVEHVREFIKKLKDKENDIHSCHKGKCKCYNVDIL